MLAVPIEYNINFTGTAFSGSDPFTASDASALPTGSFIYDGVLEQFFQFQVLIGGFMFDLTRTANTEYGLSDAFPNQHACAAFALFSEGTCCWLARCCGNEPL